MTSYIYEISLENIICDRTFDIAQKLRVLAHIKIKNIKTL